MKRLALPRLGIPLLAALLVHGLWLSLSQLQSSRRPPPAKLGVRDDTAELLVLSRRLPEEPAMETIPLPPRLSLPPPPPALLSALPPPQAGRQRTRTAGAEGPSSGPARKGQRVATSRRPSASPKVLAAGAKPRLGTTRPLPADPGATGPLATLRTLQEQAALDGVGAGAGEEGAWAAAPGETPSLQRPAGEIAEAWRKLWEGARPDSSAGHGFADLPATVELRRLPLSQARAAGVAPSHGHAVVLADHLILQWIENGNLWLLRSPTTPG